MIKTIEEFDLLRAKPRTYVRGTFAELVAWLRENPRRVVKRLNLNPVDYWELRNGASPTLRSATGLATFPAPGGLVVGANDFVGPGNVLAEVEELPDIEQIVATLGRLMAGDRS